MSKAWKELGHSKEEDYFSRRNEEALKRLRDRQAAKPRISPVSGEPMEQVTYLGVVIDRCPVTGGIWLDAGELEELLKTARKEDEAGEGDWIEYFLKFVSKKK